MRYAKLSCDTDCIAESLGEVFQRNALQQVGKVVRG
jgi:hypothetical protein